MNDPSYLTLDVGGFQYTVKRDLLLGFPDSFFDNMLKSGWKESSEAVVRIRRDGELFKFVYDYIFYGKLPRNELGMPLLSDESLLKEVLEEAKFYHLPGLVTECEGLLRTCEVEQRIKHFADVFSEIHETMKQSYFSGYKVVFKKTGPDSLLALLRSNPYAPAWVTGTLHKDCNPSIFMSTTVQDVNVMELIAAALPSPFGRGSETVLDKNVRDSMEIPASELCDLSEIVNNIDISSLAPNMNLALKPYKLVVYQKGGHFDSHRDTVRDERHIGTLVLVLNSEYTGGELEVCHGEQTMVVKGAFNWVAMYGDCVHTIRPLMSGIRVSLIFDIWNESDEQSLTSKNLSVPHSNAHDNEDNGDVNNDEDYYKHDFWPDNEFEITYWRKNDSTSTSTPTPRVGIDNLWNRIYKALDQELEKHATVAICLEHLYPACQANPYFLKGEDANLYRMLKDKYSLGVTSVTIARASCAEEEEESIGCNEFGSNNLLGAKKVVLFVPNELNSKSVLFYSPEAGYLGNEGRAQEMVYLVAVLMVRKQ